MSDEASSNHGEFEDPLANYDPKVYEDPVEQALADQTVEHIWHEPMATVAPDTTVQDAVQRLAGLHVACLLVEQGGQLLGVFSDRDVLDRIALEFDAVKDRPVREFMTDNPIYVHETDSSAAAFSVMAVAGYRHVPVLDHDDKLVGIVSPQRVIAFLQQHFNGD